MSAQDRATGKEQKIEIEASSGLSEREFVQMFKRADSDASEDKQRKEKVEGHDQLDTLICQVEKDTAEWGEKVSPDVRTRLDAALDRGKKALKQDEPGS